MDCEKFDSLILDELYGELDEPTSAAMKLHASECSGCNDKLQSLSHTREHSVLEEPDFPPGLEERILAATEEVSKVTPIGGRGRLSRVISLAGMWAMRPQTAMAALFLLMIGSSAVLLRTRQPKESAALTVTQEGSPSPTTATATEEREFDGKGAAAAHGAAGAQAPVAMASPAEPHGPMARALATAAPEDLGPGLGQLAQGSSAESKKEKDGRLGAQNDRPSGGVGGGGFAPAPATPPPPAAVAPVAKAASQPSRDDEGDAFSSGMADYQGRRYPDATRKLDLATNQGNAAAALWAARSVREASGCAAAIGRFNAVAARGGAVGQDATFDAARCYEAMGDHEAAKARYASLLNVPSYAARARAALDSSSEMASRKASARPEATGGVRAAPGKEAAPPRAPAPTAEKPTTY